MGIKVKLKS